MIVIAALLISLLPPFNTNALANGTEAGGSLQTVVSTNVGETEASGETAASANTVVSDGGESAASGANTGVPAGSIQTVASVTDAVYLVSADGSTQLLMNYINYDVDAPLQKADYEALFTSGAGVTNKDNQPNKVYVKNGNLAIAVGAAGTVEQVYGPVEKIPAGTGVPGSWEPNQYADIPQGGYVVLASDNSWNNKPYRKTLYTQYTIGDTITLTRGGQIVTAADFLAAPGLTVTTESDTTVTAPTFTITGKITGYTADDGLKVKVGEAEAAVDANGAFLVSVQLAEGLNTLSVRLLKGTAELAAAPIKVTYRPYSNQDYIEVEAAPEDITINVEGPRKKIDYIDHDPTGISNIIALYTREYGESMTIPRTSVAVQVGADSKVMRVVNPSVNGAAPGWAGPTELAIPLGGYILYAQDSSYANNDIKRFLAVKFKVGDVIKLRKNGQVVPVQELMGGRVKLEVDNYQMVTSTESYELITGRISNVEDLSLVQVLVNDTVVPVQVDGKFSYSYPLDAGINYVDVVVKKDGVEQTSRELVIFSRPGFASEKGVILWVDQAANARKFQTSKNVYDFLKKAKDSGVTEVAFDVKGVEGYASYKRNDLTGRPYVSEITAPAKAGSNPDLDLLQEFITHGHALGLKIHAAINVFAEGSIASNEFAVLDDHLDWEERVHLPENNGQIKRLRESAKQGLVAFVNPSNDEVREYELKTFEEVIKNYDVDGVVHDRGRYDNESADFSDLTRGKFEDFLQERGKQLVNWPNDVFWYDGNNRVNGPLIQDWWEFRAATIKSFFGEVKELVESYEASTGRTIEASVYVGSWYETYYLNGVNWASPNFRFDSRLGLKDESVYTPYYYQTGYIEYLDFIMIGAYQTTGQEVEKYITLGNIVTNGEIPLYAGIALTNVQEPALQREVFQAGLNNTNGLMLFDASQVNWPIAAAALKDQVYVKDYQLGFSLPNNPDSFLEGNYYNINLVENNINAYTDAFGYSTGTSRFGVEVVVGADGYVSKVANRNQAVNWSWGSPEENNSVIPDEGFVISTVDPSGTRTKRQLVANAYQTGDAVRAAVLSGYLPYEDLKTTKSQLEVNGSVEVLGHGQASVTVSGSQAVLDSSGAFKANVPLTLGANTVTMAVYVDGYKTNEKSVSIVREAAPQGGGGGGGGVFQPQPTTSTEETDGDGSVTTKVKVNAERFIADIKELSSKNGTTDKPVLTIQVGEVKDAVAVSIPAAAVRAALDQLPQGALAVKSSLGKLTIPVLAFKEVAEASENAELLISLGAPSAGQADKAAELLRSKGAAGLGKAIEVTLVVAENGSSKSFSLPSGVYSQLYLPLSAKVDPARSTLLRLGADNTLRFVPAVFVTDKEGQMAVEARVANSGLLILAEGRADYADMAGHWAGPEVELLASKLLVEGVEEGRFAPDAALTRAQFAALLVRSLGLDAPSASESGFSDVKGGDWFASEVAAAVKAGLVEGDEAGRFLPEERITREQLSVMLLRALKAAGASPAASEAKASAALDKLDDRELLSSWSEEAVALALDTGLMTGRTDGGFAPKADATRAEGAAVLKRLLQYAGFINR
jgi:uncharacterized lipoprotein YddW (UPF0748 family)